MASQVRVRRLFRRSEEREHPSKPDIRSTQPRLAYALQLPPKSGRDTLGVMAISDDLQLGNRVELSGGYDFEPAWLGSQGSVRGTVTAFIPGQNDLPAAMIKLDAPITFEDFQGNILVLELRYAGLHWTAAGIVHVELCDFTPKSLIQNYPA